MAPVRRDRRGGARSRSHRRMRCKPSRCLHPGPGRTHPPSGKETRKSGVQRLLVRCECELLAIRELHRGRQRIGDSRAVGRKSSRCTRCFPEGGARRAPGRWRSVLAFEGNGVGVGVGVGVDVDVDEVGVGSAAPADIEGVDRIVFCSSQFASKPPKVSTIRLAERTPG